MLRTLLEFPLVWFAAAFAAGWLLDKRLAHFRAAFGAGSIALLLAVAALNVRTAGFLVSFGANVLSLAAAHRNGQAMYHAVGGSQLYTLVYGPYTYLLYEPLIRLPGALTAVKLELFGAIAATLTALFLLVRRYGQTPWQTALALTGLAAAMLLSVPSAVLGIRGDVWIVLTLTLALIAIEVTPWWLAAAGAGLCCGVAVDLKATLAIEAVLILVLLWDRHGARAVLPAAAVAGIVAAAPFASANISWSNYVAWLRLSGHRESFPSLLAINLLFAAMLLAPAVLLRSQKKTSYTLPALFCVALLAALVSGAKSGGGPWHLWPLLPFVLAWTSRQLVAPYSARTQRVITALAFAGLVVSARWGLRAVRIELPRMTQDALLGEREQTAELDAVLSAHAGMRVEMAPGTAMDSSAEDLRYLLVAQGNPLTVDLIAAGEALKTDPALLRPLLAQAPRCSTLWVVPHGEIPFSTRNNNETQATYPVVFPVSVQAAFRSQYRLAERRRFFDLWSAWAPEGSGAMPCE